MLRRLARQSSVYALASVVAKASGFVLLVFYADPDVLPKADLGVLGGLDAAKAFALLVAGAGLPLGIIQFASSPALGARERAAVPATALAVAAVAGCAVAAVGWAAAAPIAAAFEMAGRGEVVRWLAVYVGFKTVADVAYTVLRQREKAGAFVLLGTLEMGLLVAAVLWFLVVQGQGLVGVMKGYAVSAAALAAVTTPLLLARVDRRVAAGLVRPMLVFGLPLVVSGFAGRFLNLGDRFLLLHFLGGEATAVYEVASRFGGVVNVFLVQSFNLAFTVLGLKALGGGAGRGGEAELHRESFRHLAAVAGWMVLGLGLFMGDVARVLFPGDPTYAQADGLTVLVAGGFAFYGLYFVVVNVLYAAGRTGAVAATVGGAAVLNLALNLALIPALGAAGAAWATLASYAALAVVTARLGQRSTPVAYPWRALAVVVAVVAGLWALAQPTAAWPSAARLAGRGGIALAYPALLVALGVYGRAELARAAGALRRRGAGDEPPRPR